MKLCIDDSFFPGVRGAILAGKPAVLSLPCSSPSKQLFWLAKKEPQNPTKPTPTRPLSRVVPPQRSGLEPDASAKAFAESRGHDVRPQSCTPGPGAPTALCKLLPRQRRVGRSRERAVRLLERGFERKCQLNCVVASRVVVSHFFFLFFLNC